MDRTHTHRGGQADRTHTGGQASKWIARTQAGGQVDHTPSCQIRSPCVDRGSNVVCRHHFLFLYLYACHTRAVFVTTFALLETSEDSSESGELSLFP